MGKEKAFNNAVTRSQSFSAAVPMDCEPVSVSQLFPPRPDGTALLEPAGVGDFISPGQ